MKLKTLEAAYRRLTKKKYTTRADLARNCDFSLMTATRVARELSSLGLIYEKKLIHGVLKLSAFDITYTVVEADMNSLTLKSFDKTQRIISSERTRRNYSFPLVEDIAIFLRGRYTRDTIFPFIFLIGVPELEARIFADLLPADYIIVPESERDPRRFMREYMLKSKIAEKALANAEKV